jgi:Xaa-Pro aminopeptidase
MNHRPLGPPASIERRRLLGAGAAATAAATAAAAASVWPMPASAQAPPKTDATASGLALPDLSFLQDTPLCDAERLRQFMKAEGLDALVVSHPANVFYLTNHWPQLDRMGFDGSGVAIFPLDPARPITLVMHAFLYYYTHTPESRFKERLVFTYTQPGDAAAGADGEPAAQAARTMRVVDEALLTERDRHRNTMFALARPPSADASWALKKAVTELQLAGKTIGTDDLALDAALKLRGFTGQVRPAENLIRRARLAKSPAELKLMRFAAQANVDAAMAAALRTRALGTSRRLRAAFYAEAALRGNSGHFMVVSGSSSEAFDQPLQDGSSVSIDCVSTCRFYHGDFGRTIFVGEPPAAVVRAAKAVSVAWDEIREQLKPGMRFADIPRIGRAALARQGVDITVSFSPHSVGLFHTDHPQPSLVAPRGPDALVLEENMVLSVDCPVFMAGLGGTVHLEDLMLIRNGRAEPLHTVPPPIIVV